jgi:hypothetical protein
MKPLEKIMLVLDLLCFDCPQYHSIGLQMGMEVVISLN